MILVSLDAGLPRARLEESLNNCFYVLKKTKTWDTDNSRTIQDFLQTSFKLPRAQAQAAAWDTSFP